MAAPALPSFTERSAAFARACFNGPVNIAISLACIALLVWLVPPLFNWAVVNATWNGTAATCRENGGACWAFIREKFWFSVFGLYPYEERWRPGTMLVILVTLVICSTFRVFWNKWLLIAWVVAAPTMLILMGGGYFGLTPVPTRLWGGITITGIIAVYGLALGYPLAILLALGRRSNLTLVRWFSTVVIECVRGVPLISLLFMAAIMLPLFLPEGITLDRLARVLVAYTIFTAAYMAEVVRGGLQAMPRGQYEAADAVGLSYWQKMRLVILPQALSITIPSQVNTFIGLFKDTTLVIVIGVFDFFTTLRSALGDPNWLGFPTEAYVFAAGVYFVLCFAMSKYSQKLERDFQPAQR
ncbi:amino acid ABC transporter permease [Roseococcus sp. SDR]|uniref:amino acid ABC transporter permease n=1 Tax=Roseococcus sp. SDR TaxID=2835532 RepID=UPI001BD075AD|nr:amino acid ABC transporter permease [Roseococcus sp. SDR]MBS7788768.1 amino acid ABC transporter permease [Roseococcus sp. SDR]MBV1844082.1 amino acid ABC transporter permease [Roseococcus sp. SDR]